MITRVILEVKIILEKTYGPMRKRLKEKGELLDRLLSKEDDFKINKYYKLLLRP